MGEESSTQRRKFFNLHVSTQLAEVLELQTTKGKSSQIFDEDTLSPSTNTPSSASSNNSNNNNNNTTSKSTLVHCSAVEWPKTTKEATKSVDPIDGKLKVKPAVWWVNDSIVGLRVCTFTEAQVNAAITKIVPSHPICMNIQGKTKLYLNEFQANNVPHYTRCHQLAVKGEVVRSVMETGIISNVASLYTTPRFGRVNMIGRINSDLVLGSQEWDSKEGEKVTLPTLSFSILDASKTEVQVILWGELAQQFETQIGPCNTLLDNNENEYALVVLQHAVVRPNYVGYPMALSVANRERSPMEAKVDLLLPHTEIFAEADKIYAQHAQACKEFQAFQVDFKLPQAMAMKVAENDKVIKLEAEIVKHTEALKKQAMRIELLEEKVATLASNAKMSPQLQPTESYASPQLLQQNSIQQQQSRWPQQMYNGLPMNNAFMNPMAQQYMGMFMNPFMNTMMAPGFNPAQLQLSAPTSSATNSNSAAPALVPYQPGFMMPSTQVQSFYSNGFADTSKQQ